MTDEEGSTRKGSGLRRVALTAMPVVATVVAYGYLWTWDHGRWLREITDDTFGSAPARGWMVAATGFVVAVLLAVFLVRADRGRGDSPNAPAATALVPWIVCTAMAWRVGPWTVTRFAERDFEFTALSTISSLQLGVTIVTAGVGAVVSGALLLVVASALVLLRDPSASGRVGLRRPEAAVCAALGVFALAHGRTLMGVSTWLLAMPEADHVTKFVLVPRVATQAALGVGVRIALVFAVIVPLAVRIRRGLARGEIARERFEGLVALGAMGLVVFALDVGARSIAERCVVEYVALPWTAGEAFEPLVFEEDDVSASVMQPTRARPWVVLDPGGLREWPSRRSLPTEPTLLRRELAEWAHAANGALVAEATSDAGATDAERIRTLAEAFPGIAPADERWLVESTGRQWICGWTGAELVVLVDRRAAGGLLQRLVDGAVGAGFGAITLVGTRRSAGELPPSARLMPSLRVLREPWDLVSTAVSIEDRCPYVVDREEVVGMGTLGSRPTTRLLRRDGEYVSLAEDEAFMGWRRIFPQVQPFLYLALEEHATVPALLTTARNFLIRYDARRALGTDLPIILLPRQGDLPPLAPPPRAEAERAPSDPGLEWQVRPRAHPEWSSRSAEAIGLVIREHLEELRACYDATLSIGSEDVGSRPTSEARFAIGPDGLVRTAVLTSSTTPGQDRCLIPFLRGLEFPPHEAVDVASYSFVLAARVRDASRSH